MTVFSKQIYAPHDGYAYYIIVENDKQEKLKRAWASVEATNNLVHNLAKEGYEYLTEFDKKPVFVKKDCTIKEEIKKSYADVKYNKTK